MLMENEKYQLHSWDKKNIFVKQPQDRVGQSVTQTILSLRRYLIGEKIQALNSQLQSESAEDSNLLEEINMYNELRQLVSQKLSRVV
jgi:DNA primase